MNDLISRQAALEAIEEYADRLQMVDWKENPGVPYKAYALNWCINTIRDLPPAQPERKKGKWVHGREIAREMVGDAVTVIFYEGWQCSECKCIVEEEREPLWNFCPSCGADMRGGQDDESRSKSNAQTDTRARGMGATDKSSGI